MSPRIETLLAQLRAYEPDDGLEAAHRRTIGGVLDLHIHPIPAGKGEPAHDHFDVRYLARTATPEAIAIDRAESNELAWVDLARAAELMPGAESRRAIRKIERMLTGGTG